MREYELTVVFDLSVAEAGGNDAAPNHVDTLIAARGGTVLRHDHWGRRRMAYPINRTIDADYVVSRIEIEPGEVTPLEAAMRIDERIYRHLIVRADELPVPPPPREPRRMPSEVGDASAPTAEVPADAISAEASAIAETAITAPALGAEPDEASPESTEPEAASVEAAAVEPAAEPLEASAIEPAAAEASEAGIAEEPDVATPITEAPVAAVESEPTEAEATAEAETEDEAPSA